MTIRRTPSAVSILVSAGIDIAPVACWPPVMATAELYSSLYVTLTPLATAARTARLPE